MMMSTARTFASTAGIKGHMQSPFGPLVNIRPFPPYTPPAEDLELVKDVTGGKMMHLIEKQNRYFVFDDKATYGFSVKYHNALKGRFLRKFTGSKGHPKDPYRHAKTLAEKFRQYQMMQSVVSRGLSHVGYHMFKDGTLNLAGKVPACKIMSELLPWWKAQLPGEWFTQSYVKPDFFVSTPLFHDALMAEQFESGMDYDLAENLVLKVRASYGLAMPMKEHLVMFNEYVIAEVSKPETRTLELNSGTGILSVLLALRGLAEVHAVDPNIYAHRALKLNMEEQELAPIATKEQQSAAKKGIVQFSSLPNP